MCAYLYYGFVYLCTCMCVCFMSHNILFLGMLIIIENKTLNQMDRYHVFLLFSGIFSLLLSFFNTPLNEVGSCNHSLSLFLNTCM